MRASMLAVTLYSLGAGIVSMSYDLVTLLIGRLVLGVGVGLTFVTVNLYLVDIAPVKLRGATVMVFEVHTRLPASRSAWLSSLGHLRGNCRLFGPLSACMLQR